MSGYPGQGQYGAAPHRPGNAGFSNGGPGPGYGYGNYGPGPSGPPGPPPPGYGNYGPPQGGPPPGGPPPGYGNYGPPPPGPRPPPGPPGWGQGGSPGAYNQYPPPPRPPPPGLDAYGYPMQGGGYGYNARAGPPPPTAPQQFGHGAPQGYTFQYSNCTGKRKALLIGINYFGQSGQLRGCINDVHNVSNFLCERYNYKREDMVILTDDQTNPVMQPTKANIIRAMEWLVKGAQPNDALFLHYSGRCSGAAAPADLDMTRAC